MNLLRYVETNKETFETSPINKLDVLCFVWATYSNLTSIAPRFPLSFPDFAKEPICDELELLHESFVPETSARLFRSMLASPRYQNCSFLGYDHVKDQDKDIQFGAIAFQADGKIVVVFEGTDLSYVGWKEDCVMSYSDSIGSYPLAMRFLKQMMERFEGNVILAGHSKGGNIAAYLLANIADDSRIEKAYSFEGPGFRNPDVFAPFPERAAKLEKFIPHSSVVGVLLNNETEARIVKSRSIAVLQHNALKWVIRDGDFVYLSKRTVSSRFVDKTANEWIARLSDEERERFVNLLFSALNQTEVSSFGQLVYDIAHELPLLYRAYKGLNEEDRAFFRRVIRALGKQALATTFSKKRAKPALKIEKPSE